MDVKSSGCLNLIFARKSGKQLHLSISCLQWQDNTFVLPAGVLAAVSLKFLKIPLLLDRREI